MILIVSVIIVASLSPTIGNYYPSEYSILYCYIYGDITLCYSILMLPLGITIEHLSGFCST